MRRLVILRKFVRRMECGARFIAVSMSLRLGSSHSKTLEHQRKSQGSRSLRNIRKELKKRMSR
jgi:hypothetical protein